jgi:signal peptidase II
MRRAVGLGLALVFALSVLFVDQVLKRLVEGSMYLGESIPVIPGVLHFTYVKNDGGAFGILAGRGDVLLLASAVALAFVLWMLLVGPTTRIMALGCGLILGGAVGNLLDRLSAGEVTDYVDLQIWPVFNAADAAIVLGAVTLILLTQRPERAARRSATSDQGKSHS